MELTLSQLQTLKAWVIANANSVYEQSTADTLNELANPAFIVWRTEVTADETGNAWVGTDVDGMSSLNMQRLQLLLASSNVGLFDMSRADRRAGFENPFGANQNNASRVAMRAVWKRSATVAEKLYATGTGSDASPANTTIEGSISVDNLIQAANS